MTAPRTYVHYAHPEGRVGPAYLADSEQLTTAGADGELRLWTGVEDDPESYPLGETLIRAGGWRRPAGVRHRRARSGAVPAARGDGGQRADVLHRCPSLTSGGLRRSADGLRRLRHAGARQLAGRRAAARAGRGRTEQLEQEGLSVALDSSAAVLLTTCCNGGVTWVARAVRKLASHALLAVCNDVSTAPSPARPAWSPDGRSATVPVGDGVRLFGGDDWAEKGRLDSDLVSRPVTACTFSPCGRFQAAANADGLLLKWRLVGDRAARRLDQLEGRLRVNALCWYPQGVRLAFADNAGQLGVTSNVRAGRQSSAAAADADTDPLMDIDSLQDAIDDDDDDRDLLEAALDGEKNTLDDLKPLDDDDEDE